MISSLKDRKNLLDKLKILADNMSEFSEEEMEYLISVVEEDVERK